MCSLSLTALVLLLVVNIAHPAVAQGTSNSVTDAWDEWSDWGSCSEPCGSGIMTRVRNCTHGPPEQGNIPGCQGDTEEVKSCTLAPCSGSPDYTEWSVWSSCDSTCGLGHRIRYRNCSADTPVYGAGPCGGHAQEIDNCQSKVPCPGSGSWGEWSQWAKCDVKCGDGFIRRSRSCEHETHDVENSFCGGESTEKRPCHAGPCKIGIAGAWTTWGEWEVCNVDCGPGLHLRERNCTFMIPHYGAFHVSKNAGFAPCRDDWEDTEPCERDPCPANGNWTEWSTWSKCDAICGTGLTRRTRACIPLKVFNGTLGCKGWNNETVFCRARSCAGTNEQHINMWASKGYLTEKAALLDPIQSKCKDPKKVLSGRVTAAFWPEMNIAYCPIPKTASMFFWSLQNEMGARLKDLVYNPESRRWRDDDVFRFMFVREPLSRLWSGYVDKIIVPGFWHKFDPMFNALNMGNCSHVPSFKEFMDYIASRHEDPGSLCTHWAPVRWVCDVCYFKPNYIGKLEDFETDVSYLSDKFNFSLEFHSTFTHEAHMRDFLLVPNMMALYDEHKMADCGLTPLALMRRLWRSSQLGGRISMTAEFPLVDFQKLEPITMDKFKMCLAIFNRYRLSGSEARAQRHYLSQLAFASLSRDTKEKLAVMYEDDFDLFRYQWNPHVFK